MVISSAGGHASGHGARRASWYCWRSARTSPGTSPRRHALSLPPRMRLRRRWLAACCQTSPPERPAARQRATPATGPTGRVDSRPPRDKTPEAPLFAGWGLFAFPDHSRRLPIINIMLTCPLSRVSSGPLPRLPPTSPVSISPPSTLLSASPLLEDVPHVPLGDTHLTLPVDRCGDCPRLGTGDLRMLREISLNVKTLGAVDRQLFTAHAVPVVTVLAKFGTWAAGRFHVRADDLALQRVGSADDPAGVHGWGGEMDRIRAGGGRQHLQQVGQAERHQDARHRHRKCDQP